MTDYMTDLDIQRNVLQELRWDSRIDAAGVGVSVKDGVVTLTGTVGSYAERMAARDAAHRVEGVLDVADDVEVVIPGERSRSDSAIAAAVRQALEWDVLVPEHQIQSTVSKGWVTLEGQVNTWQQRHEAERAIRHLAGVRGVSDLMEVEQTTVDPEKLRSSIEEALSRRAEREARRIEVRVQDGTVTLTGRVQNWNERQAIMGAIGHARGVHAVVDELRVGWGG